jgi:hypothetical protein
VFSYNSLNTLPTDQFRNWQTDSESLVLNKIEATKDQAPTGHFGLLETSRGLYSSYEYIDKPSVPLEVASSTDYPSYKSSIGLQGWFFNMVYNRQGFFNSLNRLHALNVLILSLVLLGTTYYLLKTTNQLFTAVFVLTTISSPWLTMAGQNLFWVIWTWFLPLMLGLAFTYSKTKLHKNLLLGGIALAFAVKFACGYEFVSTLALLAVSAPFIYHMIKPDEKELKSALFDGLKILAASVAGFVIAIIAHAFIRGKSDVILGLQKIVTEDIFRRTYGDPNSFMGVDPATIRSLKASTFSVVRLYLFDFPANFEVFNFGLIKFEIAGTSFFALLVITLFLVVYRATKGQKAAISQLIALVALAVAPISWLILGKAHSYVHPHINFVIWYLAFPAVLFWVLFSSIKNLLQESNLFGFRVVK